MHWKCVLAVTRCKKSAQSKNRCSPKRDLSGAEQRRKVSVVRSSKSLDLLLKEQLTALVLTRPGQKQDNMLKVIRWTSFNAINIESF